MVLTTGGITSNIEEGDAGGSSEAAAAANLSKLIDAELDYLEDSFLEAKRRAEQIIAQIKESRHKSQQLQQRRREESGIEIESELRELKKEVSKLRFKIPFNLITPSDVQPHPNLNRRPRSNHKPHPATTNKPHVVVDGLVDNGHPSSEDLKSSLTSLDDIAKYILLAFLVFPEKSFIKWSLLLYFVDTTIPTFDEKESIVLLVQDLVSKGFIKTVYKNCSRSVSGFWMHPFVRNTLKESTSFIDWLDTCDMSFRVNSFNEEEDVIYSGSAEYSTMKYLRFLHLGNWQRSSTHHIEMEDPNLFFKYTEYMPFLQYISFRGVSMITELPKHITKFTRLSTLDLKACYNLEVIPSDIGNLWALTYLDMSECYFLDHMPKSLSHLIHLRVLKGFLVGETDHAESCTLQDLSSLTYLFKLNIYTSVKTFPNEDQLTALKGFQYLRNLTISWAGCSTRKERHESRPKKTPSIRPKKLLTHDPDYRIVATKKSSFKLRKLDLQALPEKANHSWLRPSNFKDLKNLYIRGGQFNDLGHKQSSSAVQEDCWSVEILRLKHLSKLQVVWSELRNLFPKVVSVDKSVF